MKSSSSKHQFGFPPYSQKSGPLISDSRKMSGSSSLSSGSSTSSRRGRTSGKMKIIIALGVVLPVLAAIIGVSAWAVSAADSAFLPSRSSRQRARAEGLASYDDNYVDVLESRNDLDQSSNGIISVYSKADSKIPQRIDPDKDHVAEGSENKDFRLPTLPPADSSKEDPLYIVHFVPSPQPNSETVDHENVVSPTENSQLIEKIISGSTGKKTGVPQFVVFAPPPGMEGGGKSSNDKGEETPSQEAKALADKQYDYEYEDRIPKTMIMQNEQMQRNVPGDVSRTGVVIGSAAQTDPEILFRNAVLSAANLTRVNSYPRGSAHQQSPQVQTVLQGRPLIASQNVQHYHHAQQQQQQQFHQPALLPQRTHQLPSHIQSTGATSNQQGYAGNSHTRFSNLQHNEQQQVYNQGHTGAAQPEQVARFGEIGPVGIKLSLGTGNSDVGYSSGGGGYNNGYGAGLFLRPNYSPLGIISTLVRSLVPRANANLNGKVMFGVMLENGLKLGERRPQRMYYG